jgi:hypothetical protein
MQNLAIILTFLISGALASQTNYQTGMQSAFELWGKNQPSEASNLFERIAQAESNEWLPNYYAAQINIVSSFGERDIDKLKAQLDKAQNFINDANTISKNNPELLVLQALLHTAWVAYDGATYGMTLSPKVTALYAQAKQLAPENPRVVYCKADWDMGSARFFGQDTAPFCKDIEKSLDLFANFKPESPFHPKWGKNRAEQILESCNK